MFDIIRMIDGIDVYHSMCAGKDLAVQMLFISLATILWAFDIEKAVDARGDPITPLHGDPDLVDNGIVVYVEPSAS